MIIRELILKGNKGTKKVEALFSTGTEEVLLNEEIASEFCTIQPLKIPKS